MLEGRDIRRAVGLPASTCLAVPPHRRDGIAWERGRPARILSRIAWERGRPARILSLWPPLGFSAMPQSRCRRQLPCRREQQRPGRRRAMALFLLIQVGEMAVAVPGLVRAGRPRSREAIIP